MSISDNYIGLQRKIADELGDNQTLLTPLADSALALSPIQAAIQSAIAYWERVPFYFNDLRFEPTNTSPFQTVAGQEFYGATDYAGIGTIATIKSLRILVGNNRYPLTRRDSNFMNDMSINPENTGEPTDFSYDAEQIRLYPIPSQVWPLGITGTLRLPALAIDTDTNAWTQDAWDLIRSEAKRILGRDTLKDPDVVAAAKEAIYGDPVNPKDSGYLGALKAETTRRNSGRAKIRPSQF